MVQILRLKLVGCNAFALLAFILLRRVLLCVLPWRVLPYELHLLGSSWVLWCPVWLCLIVQFVQILVRSNRLRCLCLLQLIFYIWGWCRSSNFDGLSLHIITESSIMRSSVESSSIWTSSPGFIMSSMMPSVTLFNRPIRSNSSSK